MINFKKFFEKFFVFSFILISALIIPFSNSFADSFYENKINVKINKDGSADIESTMDFKPTNGTEYFIPIENLGESKILNFRVSEVFDGKEVEYEPLDSWNTKASRMEKARKSGVIKTQKGYELCFGFGEYERKTFVLRYKVTNFVKILNDSDMIFWKFVNDSLSAPPKKVNVTISKEDGKFDNTNSKIWAFGNKGKIEFIDGKIEFKSLEGLNSSNYVTILTRLNKGEFTSGEKINKDFSYYQDMAFKNSQYTKKDSQKSGFNFKKLYRLLYVLAIIPLLSSTFKSKKIKGGYKKGDLKEEYYRSLPTKEWENLSMVLDSAGFDANKSLIRSYFLKWIQNKLLIPIKEETGFIFKKETMSLKINDHIKYEFDDKTEENLFKMVEVASRDDRILQQNEFKKYLEKEKNRNEFKSVTNNFNVNSKNFLIKNNYLKTKENGKTVLEYSEEGKEFTKKLISYYNYLKDFTLLNEREVLEIKVWKELLIYATLFDVAEEVQKQLNKIAPEVLEEYDVDVDSLHTAMIYSAVFSNTFVDAYSSAVASSSSGGGGFSSISGGGGSFGGGSGGGTR